jgi:hypothetical protein
VSDYVVPIPYAASGVIAENVEGLHAIRTRNNRGDNRVTKAVRHRRPKQLGPHHAVRTVHLRGNRRHKSACVVRGNTGQSLPLAGV